MKILVFKVHSLQLSSAPQFVEGALVFLRAILILQQGGSNSLTGPNLSGNYTTKQNLVC